MTSVSQLDRILLGDRLPAAAHYEVWWKLYLEGLSTEWPAADRVAPEFAPDAYPHSTGSFPPEGFHHRRHPLDFERSLFGFWVSEIDPDDVPILDARCAARTEHQLFVRGADMAELRSQLAWDTSDLQHLSPILALVCTDGSLGDAMLHATFRADGVLHPFDHQYGEVDPEWIDRLNAIGDLALREHAQMLCQSAHSARCTGALFSCPGRGFDALDALGRQPVARWDFGEGQGALIVVAARSPS
jgi:hypothetical protein